MSKLLTLPGSYILIALLAGLLTSCFPEAQERKPYQVTADSRNEADMDTVFLTIRRKPHCGKEAYNAEGINGEGLFEHRGKKMEVIVEPCVTTGEVVKMPDGRILFLKEIK